MATETLALGSPIYDRRQIGLLFLLVTHLETLGMPIWMWPMHVPPGYMQCMQFCFVVSKAWSWCPQLRPRVVLKLPYPADTCALIGRRSWMPRLRIACPCQRLRGSEPCVPFMLARPAPFTNPCWCRARLPTACCRVAVVFVQYEPGRLETLDPGALIEGFSAMRQNRKGSSIEHKTGPFVVLPW
jgi:hypothetical protein